MKQQTGLEWLLFELSKVGYLPNGIPDEIHKQAKEIDKQNIMKAFLVQSPMKDGVVIAVNKAEKYYNDTFK